MFPQYDYVEVKQEGPMSATDVRELYFEDRDSFDTLDIVDMRVANYLRGWSLTQEYTDLVKEYAAIKAYKNSWRFAPYKPTFVTTDAVIIESGHVLLIQRGQFPGAGQWALPGGFVETGERVIDSAIREVHEETGLKVPPKVLRGSVRAERTFDKVDRDPRGRFITHAFLFNLAPCPTGGLTKVKGGDDAAHAEWVPLAEVEGMKDKLFLDHYDIIFTLLGEI
jgi:bifunctional NMN adenylyltransferase/nudix hydrolase